ncbi:MULTISPECIES: SPOR domain-containing protein [Halanaerobium]|jgi:cell division septation protein DedD|uniref:Sporulation related protein n=1 Tax=Halanaerobium saccharolyticum TaxID=43595 RepID=A0A4R6SCP0_9FIRM|nr:MULTISPECIES: SPOR domain-containing protein [Halanaerobium]PUU90734.1 MAG: sporulation domain-containing protein [Halanaerobium sp.]PUU93724.1 MAG: sporulation domain-containing protein [Halanaerobium sp.]TDP96826.1 sporulation related protein [Halanaerobium saccharolyticum]
MSKKENGFSLVVVVIFMSIAALFIGYLTGSYLISFLVEEDESQEMADQAQNPPAAEESKPEPEELNNSQNNLTAPTEEEQQIAVEQAGQSQTETAAPDENQSTEKTAAGNSSPNGEEPGGFRVQIGAFSNYNNALTVKETVSELGYQVLITDSSPHQVQVVGYKNRDEAETAAADLEEEGYPGFIVIRE